MKGTTKEVVIKSPEREYAKKGAPLWGSLVNNKGRPPWRRTRNFTHAHIKILLTIEKSVTSILMESKTQKSHMQRLARYILSESVN